MREPRNPDSGIRTGRRILVAALAAGLCACVGSETGGTASGNRGSDQSASRPPAPAETAVKAVYLDTVPPLRYQVFEIVPEEAEPQKVTYRLMMLRPGTQKSMTKTVRLALDSLQRADTTLAAVRVVLYAFQRTARMEGKLIPVIWGEWVPPDGWDDARPSERRRIHRSYVYAVNPGWDRAAAADQE